MCACISYPKKDKDFCPKEQIKGFTSCWMDANATTDELGMMCRCGKIEKVMKNKRCGNIKKAIWQGLVCSMVGKEQKAYFQSALGLFSLAGHFNWFKCLFAIAFNPRFFFFYCCPMKRYKEELSKQNLSVFKNPALNSFVAKEGSHFSFRNPDHVYANHVWGHGEAVPHTAGAHSSEASS